METPECIVRTRGLTKHYRHPLLPWIVRSRALTDLDLEVNRGESFGLLGPNGSGKSTTIKLLLALVFPTSGSVEIFGDSPRSRSAKARIGYLPEETWLYPWLTPKEILDFFGRLFGLSRAERRKRTGALLDFVGLAKQGSRPIGQFSKGMQRRVAIAQSLVGDPDLVIFDEPTTGMDAIGIAEIKALIRDLRTRGKTVILCSHRMSDVEDVCDRLTILYGGRQQVTGTVRELVEDERLVQVVASMAPETAEAVARLIREREGDGVEVRVAPAHQRLEPYFLRVIEAARARGEETSGAERAGPASLDFLGSRGPARAAPEDCAGPIRSRTRRGPPGAGASR